MPKRGVMRSGAYIGEDRRQNLKMGLLPGAFSLLWGSAFGATAHAAVHGAAPDASCLYSQIYGMASFGMIIESV